MLRKITSLALLLVATSVFASPISKQAALNTAKAFFLKKGINTELMESKAPRACARKSNAEGQYYYIFNANNNKGFVIVSGDDCLKPILGYSDTGNIDTDNIPGGLQMLLDAYSEAIDDINMQIEKGLIDTSVQKPRNTMAVSRNPVQPFLDVAYGQTAPFYNKNPKKGSAYTNCSCTTVVIGQIMAYYQYPEVLPALDGYTTYTLGLEVDSLPEHVMQWSNVLPYYNGVSATSAQKSEVATLMRYIGQHGQCDFNEGASSSYDTKVYYTLVDFGYKVADYTTIERKQLSEWEDIIYQDLINQRPVAVCGTNIRIGGARHAFIFDGYDQDGLYHVDWGWEGNCRGYYSFEMLSPYNNTSSYTYMKNLSIAYRIAPKNKTLESYTIAPSECLELTSLYLTSGNIATRVRNDLGRTANFKYGLGLYDDKFNLLKVICEDSLSFSKDKYLTVKWTNYDFSNIDEGEYRVYPISKLAKGDGIWHFDKVACANAYCIAKVTAGEGTFSVVKSTEYNSFTRDESLELVRGAAREYKLNMTNNTMDKMQSRLYLYEDSVTPIEFVRAMVPANSTKDVIFTYFPQSTGNHVLMLTTDTAKTNVIFTDTVNVLNYVKYSLTLDSMVIDSYTSSGTLYNNRLRFRFKLTNNGSVDYDDYVRPLMRKTTWNDTEKFLAHIPVNGSQWFEMETKEMVWNHSYGLTINVKSKSSDDPNILPTALYSKTFTPRPGIRYWKKNGKVYGRSPVSTTYTTPEDVLAVDFTAPDISVPNSIVPNSNPNTLYYVTQSYDSLDSLNQIINGEASNIVLHDSISCLVPMDFKADSISYTRTFEKGFMGKRNQNNWTTIALPFTVQKVYNTVDSVDVDWYKPGDIDESKNFWVREFYSSEGYDTYFTNASTMKANVPYIITVPGDYRGPDTCLVNKPLVFSAVDADVLSNGVVSDTYNYDFVGSYIGTNANGNYIYMLDEENQGNNFKYIEGGDTINIVPFRAYFTSDSAPLDNNTVLYVRSYIDFDPDFENATSIKSTESVITRNANKNLNGVYTISGTKVSSLSDGVSIKDVLGNLPSGIYIINGKKYVK